MDKRHARTIVRCIALLTGLMVVAVGGVFLQTPVRAASGALPGGTSIAASISSPSSGSTVPTGNLEVHGTAQVGAPGGSQVTDLIYVLDVSGSTSDPGSCGDFNDDGASTVLDCEVRAFINLTSAAIQGTIRNVAVIAFGATAAIADLDQAPEDPIFKAPGASTNADPTPDVIEVLRSADEGRLTAFSSADVGRTTNFEAAVQAVGNVRSQAIGADRVIVAFLSDGIGTAGGPAVDDASALPADVDIEAFAFGGPTSCVERGVHSETGEVLDSLEEVATATGGSCTLASGLALSTVVPQIIASRLVRIDVSLDGATAVSPVTSQPLPQSGPVDVTWSRTFTDIAPGPHTICVTARGQDSGGDGSVQDCVDVVAQSTVDTDGDGVRDSEDDDDDNDGVSDADEIAAGSDPLSGDSAPEVCDGADNDADGQTDEGFADIDADGSADCVDGDDDNDGASDAVDNCAAASNADQADTDGDGTGDACDELTYVFTGFSAPVDNPAVVNVANAGRTVPVKYRITTLDGTPITDPASFEAVTSVKVGCGTLDVEGTDTVETYSGSSGLQNLGEGFWQVNWATPKSYAGATQGPCRVMTLDLADGSSHSANFRFR